MKRLPLLRKSCIINKLSNFIKCKTSPSLFWAPAGADRSSDREESTIPNSIRDLQKETKEYYLNLIKELKEQKYKDLSHKIEEFDKVQENREKAVDNTKNKADEDQCQS